MNKKMGKQEEKKESEDWEKEFEEKFGFINKILNADRPCGCMRVISFTDYNSQLKYFINQQRKDAILEYDRTVIKKMSKTDVENRETEEWLIVDEKARKQILEKSSKDSFKKFGFRKGCLQIDNKQKYKK